MKKLFYFITIILFATICYAASGDVSGTVDVDGANPSADRIVIAVFAYGTIRDVNQAGYRFATTRADANGDWSVSGFNAGESVIIHAYDSTDVKQGRIYEDTAEE